MVENPTTLDFLPKNPDEKEKSEITPKKMSSLI
jgi:hypothetical protein